MTNHEIRRVETLAYIYSHTPPTDEQKQKLQEFLEGSASSPVSIVWKKDDTVKDGFRIETGTSVYNWSLDKVYDWSAEGRSRQLKEKISAAIKNRTDIMPLIKQTIDSFKPEPSATEVGSVLTVGDGIATVSGLAKAEYGEILIFENGMTGMVLDLKEDEIGCVIFGDDSEICENSPVRRSKKTAGIPVGDAFIGRIVDALGNPIDGLGEIKSEGYYPIENEAPSIIDRQSVNEPLETGILAIDSMFPIGRGQRELIIGDRQTGKTAIAVDTILNQKDTGVICIYVAIGQKASSVAQLAQTLRSRGAMDYSIIVSATASDAAPLQYIAPYAGCALGEYFMHLGKDVLIIYDDLSKHAIAYRTLSLLLERSPGREAYPGDVFYLHSRLLERSAKLCDRLGGGSMSALPIVETQAGDVSAYIPTNIISITDGQIFLESELFFAGQRPAVNIGLSVSRVGGAAQTKAIKKAAGSIRLDLAQYREMEVFTQFSSDLDELTKNRLDYGLGLMQLLKQEQYHPLKQYEQVILLVAALSHTFTGLDAKQIPQISRSLLEHIKSTLPDICTQIENTKQLSDENKEKIISSAKEFISHK